MALDFTARQARQRTPDPRALWPVQSCAGTAPTGRPLLIAIAWVNVLIAQISASDIAAAGTAAVTVFNPPPGGGSSNSLTFTTTTGGVDPQSIAVDSAGKFAYVANAGCVRRWWLRVHVHDQSRHRGPDVHRTASVLTDDEGTDSVTVDPFGKFAYVASSGLFDTDGSVDIYTINATTGALTYTGAIDGNSPDFCCFNSVAVDPSGKFAYVADGGGGSNSVAMYTINATTGALTSIGTIAVGGFAQLGGRGSIWQVRLCGD